MTRETTVTIPENWASGYTEADKKMVANIIAWLVAEGRTRAWLYRTARVEKGTGSVLLAGSYGAAQGSSPTKHLTKLWQTLQAWVARSSIAEMPWVETSTARLVQAACNRARKYRTFAIITGHVGTGKTSALKHYAGNNANTVLVEADPHMSAGSLIDELIRALGVDASGKGKTVEKRYKALLAALAGTETLLILDEAENVHPKALHYLRRLRDKCGIGIVLAGREELYGLITPPVHAAGGEFDQIHSRAGFMPPTIRRITDDDMDALVEAFLGVEVAADVLARFRHWGRGCARMLVENLLPTVRDYGLAKHELSAPLVDEVARQVLNLK